LDRANSEAAPTFDLFLPTILGHGCTLCIEGDVVAEEMDGVGRRVLRDCSRFLGKWGTSGTEVTVFGPGSACSAFPRQLGFAVP
jgi:hypothetical protein